MRYLKVKEKAQVAYITFNHPEEFNTLSLALMEELTDLLNKIGAARKVKVIVLKGGDRAFSAGHSLREIQAGTPQDVDHIFRRCYTLMQTMREIPQLIISKVQGVAVAAGAQVVAMSDLALASKEARFAVPGINSGLFCSTPAVFLSRNIGRKKAVELLFTGEFMTADDALHHGLVNKVVPLAQLPDATETMVQAITKQSLNIIELGKRQFYAQLQMEDFAALNYSTEVITSNTKHPDAVEGIDAFFDKRSPVWPDES